MKYIYQNSSTQALASGTMTKGSESSTSVYYTVPGTQFTLGCSLEGIFAVLVTTSCYAAEHQLH